MTTINDKPNTGTGEEGVPGTSCAKQKRRSLRPPLSVLREIIMRNGGICSGVAAACGVADRTARSWRERDPVVAEMFDEARERVVDMAEGVIVKSLKAGNLTAAIYVTKCHGWRRGWLERHDREVEAPRDMEAENRTLRALWDNPQAREHINKALAATYRPPRPAAESN